MRSWIDAGEHVVSVVTGRGRGRASGTDVEWRPIVLVWTLREGRVVRLVWFETRDEAPKPLGARSSAEMTHRYSASRGERF